ncbi:MAG TPA: immunoglobulin domain-containing protein [Opitutaceae bacterium]
MSRSAATKSLRNAASGLFLLGAANACLALSDYSTPYALSLFAGSGTASSADGSGAAAGFNQPYGVALDSGGTLFVADKANHTIREATSGGVVTTLAGLGQTSGTTDATGADARFNQPTGVAVGSGGDIYVADSGNNAIRRVTSAGVVTTLAGAPGSSGSVDGSGKAALFRQPIGVAVDSSGNVYVTDFGNNSIRKVTQEGAVTTLAGLGGTSTTASTVGSPAPAGHADGTGASASFNEPTGIAIDSGGNLYVSDTANNTIRKVTTAGSVTTLAGTPGATGSADGTGAAARFNGPRGLTVDANGNVYVADAGNSLLRKITPAGAVTTLAGIAGNFAVEYGTGSAAILDVPAGVAVDSGGNLYVSEELGNVIAKGVQSAAVTPPVTAAPSFTTQPVSVTVAGGTVALDSAASGAASYQWMLNGAAVPGATDPTLLLTSAAAGTYTCVATNSVGSATSSPATVAVNAAADAGHLSNLSARAEVGTGANLIFGGFAIEGGGQLPVLIRGSGPALLAFNVPATLPDPQLQLFSSTDAVLATNDGWGGSAAVASAASSAGAFAWTSATSHDAALLETLPAGSYTAQVSGESGDTGNALVEIYDTSAAGSFTAGASRLVNLSARVDVGTGANVLEAGFVIAGNSALTVLIRASGPAIAAAPFNVTGTLPDPQITLQNQATGAVYAANSGWAGDAEIASTATSVGAFSWSTPSSHDSALLITLPPGNYTATASGTTGDVGVALVEVYEVP